MASYNEITAWVSARYGWAPKTCWIAHCKELKGLPVNRAPSRYGENLQEPCPPKKREAIFSAFRHFRML